MFLSVVEKEHGLLEIPDSFHLDSLYICAPFLVIDELEVLAFRVEEIIDLFVVDLEVADPEGENGIFVSLSTLKDVADGAG